VAESINEWLQDLGDALASERRLRRGRILDEARDHLLSSADDFQQQGMSRHEAEARAVALLGDPRSFARGFSQPTWRDWLVDATAWWSSRVAVILLGLGALLVLIEALAWSVGAGPVSAQGVRVWRTCRNSVDGECVGGWDETDAPSLVVLGAICLVVGLATLSVYWLLRRRYSDLELIPRLLGIGAQLSLAALGIVLLIGGTTRSSLDGSWRWVPVWLAVGLACVSAAVLLRRSDKRTQGRGDWTSRKPNQRRSFPTVEKPPA
jgi:hypothetical protein